MVSRGQERDGELGPIGARGRGHQLGTKEARPRSGLSLEAGLESCAGPPASWLRVDGTIHMRFYPDSAKSALLHKPACSVP